MKSQYVNIHLKICLAYLCFAFVFLQSLLALTPNYFNTGKRMRVVSHRFFFQLSGYLMEKKEERVGCHVEHLR